MDEETRDRGEATTRTIRTLGGREIVLDGDLLRILETLYEEVTLGRELRGTFEDMMRAIVHLVEAMDEETRKRYLVESLFLNTVTYENERLGAYLRRLEGRAGGEAKGGRGRRSRRP